ncbi:MAG TPA: flagellar hook-length control protein FliK, partial [Burkholderiales bacterium]
RAEPHNRLPLEFARSAALSNTAGAEERNATSTVTSTGTQSSAGANPAALPEALATIVREQLDTLDFRRVQWQGEVWPQQDAQLEIAEDQTRREYESETAQAWRTTLRIDLPHLGQVAVRIALDPAGIGVSVQAAHDAVAALQPGRAIFTAALRDAGIALRTVEVKANG